MAGRVPVPMTAERADALRRVAEEYRIYAQKKETERVVVMARLAAEVEKATLKELGALRDAIQHALNLGVPKSRMERPEVLGATSQGRVNDLMGGKARRQKTKAPTVAAFRWLDDGRARIAIPGYPTQSLASDYPPTLSGIVSRAPEELAGWAVEVDDTDEPDMPGHLRWEAEHDPFALGEMLDGLAEGA